MAHLPWAHPKEMLRIILRIDLLGIADSRVGSVTTVPGVALRFELTPLHWSGRDLQPLSHLPFPSLVILSTKADHV